MSSGDVRRSQSNDDRPPHMVAGLTLASVVSQVGCVTVVVIIGALAVGIALDKTLDTRPLFTILFMLGSIPVSLYLLVRIALSAVARLDPPRAKTAEDEGVSEKAPSERVPSKEE